MFTVTKYPQGTFSWADCSSTDVTAAKPFYVEVMGWEANDIPMGDGQVYTMFKQDGHDVAGFGPHFDTDSSMPSVWNSYITVDDVDAMENKVKELGGTVVVPPMDVFDNGRMMTLQDPTGAFINLWQPKSHIGAGLVNTVGAMCWNELMTTDVEKAKSFYADLLGWTYREMGGPDNYWVAENNGRSNGGIMSMPKEMAGMPPFWQIYFTVADVDKVAESVQENGGKLNMPVMDAGVGRTASVTDPLAQWSTSSTSQNQNPGKNSISPS